jgi:hypothetical protein
MEIGCFRIPCRGAEVDGVMADDLPLAQSCSIVEKSSFLFLGQADMTEPNPSPRNRRAFLRRTTKQSSRATCRKGMLGLGPDIAVRVLDLSEGGIRLLVKTPLKLGQDVEIGLLAPGGRREVLRKGKVVWVVPTAEGECCVGVQFDKHLDYSVLIDLSSLSRG